MFAVHYNYVHTLFLNESTTLFLSLTHTDSICISQLYVCNNTLYLTWRDVTCLPMDCWDQLLSFNVTVNYQIITIIMSMHNYTFRYSDPVTSLCVMVVEYKIKLRRFLCGCVQDQLQRMDRMQHCINRDMVICWHDV